MKFLDMGPFSQGILLLSHPMALVVLDFASVEKKSH